MFIIFMFSLNCCNFTFQQVLIVCCPQMSGRINDGYKQELKQIDEYY